jgi:hypothetical protein
MQIVNKHRYRLTDRNGVAILSPLGETRLALQYSREDDNRFDYEKKMQGKLTLVKEDYNRLLTLEKSTYRCSQITIVIEEKCGDTWKEIHSGILRLNEGAWDLSKCLVEIPIGSYDNYACVDVGFDEEVNVLNSMATPTKVSVLISDPRSYIETITPCNNSDCNDLFAWCGTGEPYSQGWVIYQYEYWTNSAGTACAATVHWAREVVEVPAAEVMNSSWIMVEDLGATKKYARRVTTFGCITNTVINDFTGETESHYQCGFVGAAGVNTEIDNGMLLSEVLTHLVRKTCLDYTVKSELFQINPDVVTDISYVTGERSFTDKLVLFQKSDVKRWNALNNASIANLSLEQLIEYLVEMFNVQYRIQDGNIFRIEHVSWFQQNSGLDLTIPRFIKNIQGKQQYTYETAKIPRIETFTFMEAEGADFVGKPIEYDTFCSTSVRSEQKKEHKLDKVTTDVGFIMNHPDADSKVISDDGFVLVACEDIDGDLVIVRGAPILDSGARLNNVLGWAILHDTFHKHNRPFPYGNMNGAFTIFDSIIPLKKGAKLSVPLCCTDTFNPLDKITTELGEGVVGSAEINLTTGVLEVEVLYPADDATAIDAPPVAVYDNYSTYKNIAITKFLLSNDADDVPAFFDPAVEIVVAPNHGTVTVLSGVNNGKITYTPDVDYVGDDYFIYRIKDAAGQVSNNAAVDITVRPANVAPTANPETYQTNKDTAYVSPFGVLTNDTDDYDTGALAVTAGTFATTQGGSVTIQTNGNFTYTPPTGFTGFDTFTYTVTDTLGLSGIGTVTIRVVNPFGVNASNDSFQAVKNTVLIKSAANGLLSNDTDPVGAGLHIQGTTTPGDFIVVATTAGGSIKIYYDGSFEYTPLAGYTGADSVVYTAVDAGSATSSATASFSVASMVYIRWDTPEINNSDIQGWCGAFYVTLGDQQTKDYRARYYSDLAGTTPLDVTGLNLRLNIKVETFYPSMPPSSYYTTVMTGSGTSETIFEDAVTNLYEQACDGSVVSDFIRSFTLESDSGYTVIP